jgi:hypothetical protein
MAIKLATLVALFSLLLSAAAFASPADLDMVGETEVGGAAAGEILADEHDQEEEEFELYLGPRDETIAGREDRRVD